MSASALLAKNSNPSDSQIDQAMQGNICRCGTYPRIKSAIKQAAAEIQNNVGYYTPARETTPAQKRSAVEGQA